MWCAHVSPSPEPHLHSVPPVLCPPHVPTAHGGRAQEAGRTWAYQQVQIWRSAELRLPGSCWEKEPGMKWGNRMVWGLGPAGERLRVRAWTPQALSALALALRVEPGLCWVVGNAQVPETRPVASLKRMGTSGGVLLMPPNTLRGTRRSLSVPPASHIHSASLGRKQVSSPGRCHHLPVGRTEPPGAVIAQWEGCARLRPWRHMGGPGLRGRL